MQTNHIEEKTEDKREISRAVATRRLDGIYKQRGANEFVMIRVRAPGSRWKTVDLGIVADLSRQFGDSQLHFTTRGDVELHGVEFDQVDRIIERIGKAGLTTRGACGDSVRNIVACPGTGVCTHERYNAGDLARQIAESYTCVEQYESLPRKFKISVSGCECACACPQIQDVGLVARWFGEGDGRGRCAFDVYLGGGLGRHPVLAKKIPTALPPEDVIPFLHAAIDCFNELGERKRRHRARMKFLMDRLGFETLVDNILRRMRDEPWDYQI